MIAPTYFGPRDLDEFLGTWAEIARELSGLHAGLAFERMIRDLHEIGGGPVTDLSRLASRYRVSRR